MSTVTADQGAVASAPRVGADLSAARERLGWSLEAVAAGLRIRLPFLLALEEGRIADLPGNAYAIGFLRTYAATLGLDPDELTRRFRSEAAEVNSLTELSFPAPVPSRGVPAGAVVLLGVVLAVGAYIGWYRLSGNGALPPEVVPPVPARLAPLAERAVPPATPPSATGPSATVTPNSSTPPTGSPTPGLLAAGPLATGAPAAGASSVVSSSPASSSPRTSSPSPSSPGAPASGSLAFAGASAGAASLPPGPAGMTAPLGVPAPLASADSAAASEPTQYVPPSQAAAATTMAPPAPRQADQPRIVLSATADAWMQVRDKSGQVLLNRVLHPGEFWAVPAQPSLVLTTGNAGGTDILVDGATMPSLGASGAVRRDIPLDPELLKTGKIPSASLPITTASSGGNSPGTAPGSSPGNAGASPALPVATGIAPPGAGRSLSQ